MLPHRTILLAEPDTALRASWRSALSDMGFHVTEAASGTAALQIALHSEVSLLITELYLASGDERCLVRAARRQRALRRLKILAVSRHAAQEDREWALAAGADAYLVKPVRLGQMMQIAARLARTRRNAGRAQSGAVGAAGKSE